MSNQIKVTDKKACFEWEISSFFDIFDKSKTLMGIELPKFKVIINDQITEWQLQLYPKGSQERYSKFVCLFLSCLSDVESYIKASFTLVNRLNKEVNNQSHPYSFFKKWSTICVKLVDHNCLFNNKEDLLPGDKLTIRCEIFLDKNEVYYRKIKNGRVDDFEDFGMLFDNQQLSDVTISIGKDNRIFGIFHAHKHVLAKKSEVFAAMFRHDMLENKKNVVIVEDVPYNAMKEMLRYIYTDEIADIADSKYLDLIKVADKYQILDLKTLCANEILTFLTVESSVKLLIVADNSNAATLKTKILDFIAENGETLIQCPEFKSMTQLHPQLWCELFSKIVQKRH